MSPRTFPAVRRWTPSLLLAAAAACGPDAPTAVPNTLAHAGPADPPSAARIALGTPSAPLRVTATAGNARATVTWQVPASPGVGAVLGYIVTAAPGGVADTVAAPATTATVTGLSNGTAYTFTVVAANRVGRGTASQPSAPVTPVAPPPTVASARWVTGYYVGYQRALYPETSVDFSNMTHVVFGAAQATATGGIDTTFYLDNTSGPAMARTLAARAHAAGRKAILMLGGAGNRTTLVGATSDAYRTAFVATLLRSVDALGYDGVDVDWEPLNEADKPQILKFLAALRAARPGLLLTFPVGWTNSNLGAADSFYAQVAASVNQLNIMSYEMAGNWGGWASWHSAALYGEGGNHPSSVSSSVAAYRAAGVPAAKIGVGIGTAGSCWRDVNTMLVPLDGTTADVVASDNAMSYANIVAQYYSAAAYRWDATAHMGYLSFGARTGPQQCTMVSYEDPRSAADKGAYVLAQSLGGAIVWTVGQGHVASAAAGMQDPLLRAAYTAIAP